MKPHRHFPKLGADTITILGTQNGRLATKQFVNAKSGIETVSFDAGYLFMPMPMEVRGIEQLSQLLHVIEPRPNMFVIRGEPISIDLPDSWTPRTGSGRGKDFQGNFRTPELGRRYIGIDVDKYPLPNGWMLTRATIHRAIEHLISQLPAEFHNASYYWQLSSSAGVFDKTKVSAHLWFWLARQIPDEALKRWAKGVNGGKGYRLIDPALFQHVQAHYIARPIFVGMLDPFPVSTAVGFLANLVSATFRPPFAAESADYFELPLS